MHLKECWICFFSPGLIKFFGGMAKLHPKETLKQDTFVDAVFNNISSTDLSMRTLAIDTVGFIGSTVEGKLALEKLGTCIYNSGPSIQRLTVKINTKLIIVVPKIIIFSTVNVMGECTGVSVLCKF